METNHTNTEKQKRNVPPQSLANLRPFVKDDPRANRNGRPPAFDLLRSVAQSLLQEPARDKKGLAIIGPDGKTLTNLDVLLRKWISSDDPRLQVHVVEIAYGKVPAPVTLTDKDGNSQPVTMIEVVKDRGDGSTETLRAVTTQPALADDLRQHLDASIQQADTADIAGATIDTQ